MSTGSYIGTGRNLPEAFSSVNSTPYPATSGSVLEFNSLAYLASGSVKAAAGQIYMTHCFNQTTGTIFLMLFNTSSMPTNGLSNFTDILPVAAGGIGSLDWGSWGRFNNNGIAFACSTTSASCSLAGNNPCRISILYV